MCIYIYVYTSIMIIIIVFVVLHTQENNNIHTRTHGETSLAERCCIVGTRESADVNWTDVNAYYNNGGGGRDPSGKRL